MRAKTWLIIGMLLLVPVLVFAAERTVKAPNALTVREGAGNFYPVVASVPAGKSVKIVGESGNWYQIQADGKKGYVSKNAVDAKAGGKLASYDFSKDKGFGGKVASTEITAATKGLAASPELKKFSEANNLNLADLEYIERFPVFNVEEYHKFVKGMKAYIIKTPELKETAAILPEDIELGRAIVLKFAAAQGIVKDDALIKYISMVGNFVQNQTPIYDQPFYYVVLDQDYINSFALPGGYFLITKGCLRAMQNEAELAAVLAHEMAHLVKRHGMKEMKRQETRIAGSKAMDELDAEAAKQGAQPEDMDTYQALDQEINELFQKLIKGRLEMDEFEADKYGTLYLAQSAYAYDGLVRFLTGLSQGGEEKEYVGHPSAQKRIKKINELAKRMRLDRIKSRVEAERFRSEVLTRLPAAAASKPETATPAIESK